MGITKGKLTNTKSGESLVFPMNPVEYQLEQSLDYSVEPCLGTSVPMVGYRGCAAATFRFALIFDEDLEGEVKVEKVSPFLEAARKVDSETQSVPPLKFEMGAFGFQGYLKSLRLKATRFNPKGEVSALHLDAELLSDGSYEKGDA